MKTKTLVPSKSPLPGSHTHDPAAADPNTVHGQPKSTGEVPKADNYGEGVANHNDSEAGTVGFTKHLS